MSFRIVIRVLLLIALILFITYYIFLTKKQNKTYEPFIGQWDTYVNIVYADKSIGVMNVKHIYQFNTPEYISNDKTSIMGRVIRYTDANSHKTIKNSQGVYLDEYVDEYSIHLYSLMWDSNTNRYNGKIIDVGDTTLGDFYYHGDDQIILFN